MNKIIAIGYLGGKTVYLNVTEEEARRRFTKDNLQQDETIEENGYSVEEILFEDEFQAYDISPGIPRN